MRYNGHNTKGLFKTRRDYMKLMKRLAAVVLGVALLCPMTAYAAQSQEALELYKAVEARNQNMTDMNAFYDFKMKMSGSLFENEGIGPVDMRLEMNMKMNHIQDPSQMRYICLLYTSSGILGRMLPWNTRA